MPPRDPKLRADVVRLDLEGMSWRAIARALKISRNTVREIINDHRQDREQPHSALPVQKRTPRTSKLVPFRARVGELLETYPNITAQRVFEILREKESYSGGYSIVKVLVRKLRPKPMVKPSLETPPRVPGQMAECDWSPYEVSFTHAPPMTMQAFGYTLRYSTRKYYSLHEGNGLHPLMDGHKHAFERFGAAAQRCKYDSQKPVVLRWEGRKPILNLRFVDFATYYEFEVEVCRRKSPNDKPRVERSFWELEVSFFNGRTFRDPADLRAQLEHWMNTICDPRPLKRMKHRTRMELFTEELPKMQPLPRHPYDTARVLYKLCDIEGFITWENNWYSLPYEYITEILPVRITENELFVYKPDLTCIARHGLRRRNAQEKAILPGHRPERADRGADLDQLRCFFAELGEPAAAYLSALEKRLPRSAGYHARRILALRDGYDTADLIEALSHALRYGALEHGSVEKILQARADPRRLEQYVAQESAQRLDCFAKSCAEPPDLAEYDELPCVGNKETQGEEPCPNESPQACADPSQSFDKKSKRTSNDSD